jgi:hypothetical protein
MKVGTSWLKLLVFSRFSLPAKQHFSKSHVQVLEQSSCSARDSGRYRQKIVGKGGSKFKSVLLISGVRYGEAMAIEGAVGSSALPYLAMHSRGDNFGEVT